MGGVGSKQAQLEKFGQLLSFQEKESLSRCFFAITNVQQADAFEEDKLQVRSYTNLGGEGTLHRCSMSGEDE